MSFFLPKSFFKWKMPVTRQGSFILNNSKNIGYGTSELSLFSFNVPHRDRVIKSLCILVSQNKRNINTILLVPLLSIYPVSCDIHIFLLYPGQWRGFTDTNFLTSLLRCKYYFYLSPSQTLSPPAFRFSRHHTWCANEWTWWRDF